MCRGKVGSQRAGKECRGHELKNATGGGGREGREGEVDGGGKEA